MPAVLYGKETWKKLSKAEKEGKGKGKKRFKGKALKMIFNLPIATSFIGLIIETAVLPTEQRNSSQLDNSSLMLHHNIINSRKNPLAKQIIEEQRAQNHQNTLSMRK